MILSFKNKKINTLSSKIYKLRKPRNLSFWQAERRQKPDISHLKIVFISAKMFRVLLLLTTIFTRFPGQFSCRAKCSSKHTIFLQLLLFELQGMMIFKGFFPLVKQPAIKINQFGVIFNITVKWVNLFSEKKIMYLFHISSKQQKKTNRYWEN